VAVEEAERRRLDEDRTVLAARLTLAEATKQVLAYGTAGRQLTGLTSAELDDLARRPPTSSRRATGKQRSRGDVDVPSLEQLVECVASEVGVVVGTARGGSSVVVRESVRDVKRRLADLDAQHARAVAKLDRASARRAELVAEQDRLVAVAQEDVDRTVGAMAEELGTQLTANVLGLDPVKVRRLVKSGKRTPRGSDAARVNRVR
jgi:hypothetical protein